MRRLTRLVAVFSIIAVVASPAHAAADSIAIAETETEIVITSNHSPPWRASVSKSYGAIRSLTLTAESDQEIVKGHPWANACGRWLGYHDFSKAHSWRGSWRQIKDLAQHVEIVSRSEQRVVVAIVGAGAFEDTTYYRFRQHLIFEPQGVRNDLELVNVAPEPWKCVQIFSPMWFTGGVTPKCDDPRIRVWDDSSAPITPSMNKMCTQDDFVPLPEGLRHPISVYVPMVKTRDSGVVFREIDLPKVARDRGEWSMPLGFGQRSGADAWSWWATGGASPGAIRGDYDPARDMAPMNEPQRFSWCFFLVNGQSQPAAMAGNDPLLPMVGR